jgi:farnesyl-diphosphate farnesyltransferase
MRASDVPQTIMSLLKGSSRTFALSIPLLPQPLRDEVAIAYLLFRIADTFEDETVWDRASRLEGLEAIDRVLSGEAPDDLLEAVVGMLRGVELSDPGYTELMRHTGDVMSAFDRLDPRVRDSIARHLRRTIRGMAEHLRRDEPITTVEEVRAYCYYVAGIVGELLTELFVMRCPTLDASDELKSLAPKFGEALQLVNILRDSTTDANEGRLFVSSAEHLPTLFEMARRDLSLAARYVTLLEELGADPGVVAFNSLNQRLAQSTIDLVQREGPGAKMTREAVQTLHDTIVGAMNGGKSIAAIGSAAS